MIRRPPRSTQSRSSAASDVYKRQGINAEYGGSNRAMSKAGQLAKGIKELRFIFCAQSEGSANMRNFINSSYSSLKSANPTTPILVRNANGVEPAMHARYAMGRESKVSLAGADSSAITAALDSLNKQA
eukprot:TRINITY_DN4297_c0_g1_i1.p1 TRINITY_DN4297_c0_g1~~TRINITY_DN4297_c0_g1_i1.p1  ORF type:complete len:129 (-),score=37.17 TRINITY_DN4297_c0_g1_i1:230-616(-)